MPIFQKLHVNTSQIQITDASNKHLSKHNKWGEEK
jgi:hypothetical protein